MPNRRFTRISALFVTILFSTALLSSAQIPDAMSFQGFVTDSLGSPFDTVVTITTKLYKRGSVVYSQAHAGTEIKSGVFNLVIGAFGTMAFDNSVDLGITIGGDAEIRPRTTLQTVPYAFSLRQLRVTPQTATDGPNLIGGFTGNAFTAGVVGATICGGGDPDFQASQLPNTVSEDYATICGGFNNTAGGRAATVAGGSGNTASGGGSAIGGGAGNTTSSARAVVGGGIGNMATNNASTVGGGSGNQAGGITATVGGGLSNNAAGGDATIAGGKSNSASVLQSTISGGANNIADGTQSTVGGGNDNTASGVAATVSGGASNTADGDYSAIGGGEDNEAGGSHATIAGGAQNSAGGIFATVGGGINNSASGKYGIVPGGRFNMARGDYSFAAGYRARAKHDGSFVWNDRSITSFSDSLVSTGPNQFLIRAANGVGIGTSGPAGNLHVADTSFGLTHMGTLGGQDLIVESRKASLALYGDADIGSAPLATDYAAWITLVDVDGSGVENAWSVAIDEFGFLRFVPKISPELALSVMILTSDGDLQVSGNTTVFGDLNIGGNLSKGGGTFKIDHPLHPQSKYLYHSFVESPDMKNIYDGNVGLDARGAATIVLPAYFEALNRDFRYQLTAIGAPGPNLFVSRRIEGNSFSIAGGEPGMDVSWQVTGIRKDPYAELNRIQVEVDKPADEIGTYLHPDAYASRVGD